MSHPLVTPYLIFGPDRREVGIDVHDGIANGLIVTGVGSWGTAITGLVFNRADRGNLAVMAAAAPGVTLVPDANGGLPGFSVMGLSAAQNNVTLNGVGIAGSLLPMAAQIGSRLQVTGSDPSVGGFSGGLLAITVLPGSNLRNGTVMLMADDPLAQLAPATTRQLGHEYRQLQGSASYSGPLVRDKLFYNVAVGYGRRTNNVLSLNTAGEAGLARAGVSGEMAERFRAALRQIGAPIDVQDPEDVLTRTTSAVSRFDILPTAQRTSSVTGSYSNRTSGPTLLNALTLPSHAGESATTSTSLSADFARLVSDVYLARTRLGISAQRTDASPTLAVPEGRVLVRSRLPDGRDALATLQFGGASALPLRTRQTILEAGQDVSWFLPTNTHRPKLAAGWRRDLFADESAPNALGSYAYNSLSDLHAGIPSSYHRTLSGTRWSAGSDYMWLAASDLWRMTGRIAFQYGARLEGTRSLDRPASNRTVLETFGVRTDRAPNAVAVLPRLGLMWNVGNARSIFGSTPSGGLRATAGAYRAMLPLSTLGAALTGTGLPDATARLTCVGPATPVPNWASFLSDATTIPSACATGPVSSFADSRPNVAASAREYDSPQTWRGSIGYSRFDVKRVRVSVDAIYALTLRQASSVDLNFNGVPGLSLPAEGGRRTFAEGGRIHEASGMADPLASRVDPRFSRVNVLEADQRAESRQLSVLFSTVGARPLRSRFFYVNYVLGHVRDRVRGFDAATGQHPSSAVWGTSAADVRHSLVATMSWMMKSETFLSVSGNLRSGTPFTPLVQGDVNGDGLFNDPAFVFSPENATDSAFSRAYSTLLTTGARPIRDCLTAQRGQIAHRNSCRGPWTSYLDIVLMAPMRDLSLPGRANVSVIVNNSLGALDQLVHGARNLRGWGQAAAPSPTLFAITGFDASTSRYRYAVNPAFGDERLARSVVRAPFAVTLQVSVPITPAPSIQELNDVLAPGRTRKGSALTVVQIKQRLMQTFFQPSAHILGAKDTLQLSAEQIKRIEAVHRPYAAGIDSIFGDLATALHGRPANYSVHQERRVVLAARQQAWARLEPVIDALRVLLTPDQKDLLPVFLSNLLLPSEFKRIRRLDGES